MNSDYKNNRVSDPTRISLKQQKHIKKFVTAFFEKAVEKKQAHDKKKAERKAKEAGKGVDEPAANETAEIKAEEESDGENGLEMSDADGQDDVKSELGTPGSTTPNYDSLKRKREGEDADEATR